MIQFYLYIGCFSATFGQKIYYQYEMSFHIQKLAGFHIQKLAGFNLFWDHLSLDFAFYLSVDVTHFISNISGVLLSTKISYIRLQIFSKRQNGKISDPLPEFCPNVPRLGERLWVTIKTNHPSSIMAKTP